MAPIQRLTSITRRDLTGKKLLNQIKDMKFEEARVWLGAIR
jgi:hypothetical protein